MYQHACKTLSGISSDAIMSYTPPLNLLAIVVIMPASFILSPRWLHKLNIALIRITSWPLLLIIRLCSVGLHKQSYLVYGKDVSRSKSITYMESTAEKASHWLSWLPLPRSRSNPDRDIIEAAFNHGKKKQLNSNDWEEWTASMLQIREDQHSSDSNETYSQQQGNKDTSKKAASETPASKYGSLERSHSSPQHDSKSRQTGGDGDEGNELMPAQLSTSSPLAKIYGRARQAPPLSQQQQHQDKSKKDKRKDSDAQIESGIETLAEKTETHALVAQLVERMQQQEEAQKRIEDLLERLVGKSKD
jgi:hypothetical protein